jgi:predicted amino acid racemase
MSLPTLHIDLQKIEENARLLTGLCAARGISVAGVVKGCRADGRISAAVAAGGVAQLATSRMNQIKRIRRACPQVPTMLIRIPMIEEAGDVAEYCDYSLQSEEAVLRAVNEAALACGKRHKVILMYDVGDLREGKLKHEEVLEQALLVEHELSGLILAGVGCNLNCFAAISPSRRNLTDLATLAAEVETAIGRKLEIVSGGSTTSIPMMLQEGLPAGINHLRVGEAILLAQDFGLFWDLSVPGLHSDTMWLEAQVVEANVKPTRPTGVQAKNGFGMTPEICDRGSRARVICAIGAADVGEVAQLMPEDKRLQVLGGSSDHIIVDVDACPAEYPVGSTLRFQVAYQAMLYAFMSEDVEKQYK